MNTLISKYGFFYPVRQLTGQNIIKYLRYTKNIDSLETEDFKRFQVEKLKDVLRYSFKNIPYYAELGKKNNFNPKDFRCNENLLNIPLLTKEIIRKNSEKLMNNAIKRSFRRSTSGSQGTPLIFYKEGDSLACMDAVMYNAYRWHGIDIGAPQARFWGRPYGKKERFIASVKDFLMNRRRLSAFDLSSESFEQFYNQLKVFKPHYFYGYPSLINEFLRYISENNKDLKYLKLKGIIGTGELCHDDQKKEIERVTNAQFINEYGCTEVGVIGFDCPEGNMHLMSHNVYVEVIKDGQQVFDTEGEIVVTELNTRSFPFIRYKIGDSGSMLTDKCKCGLPHPLIKITQGRLDSYVVTPSNRKVYDAVFAYTLKKGIICFKAVQTKVDNIDLYMQVDNDYNQGLEAYYLKQLKMQIDDQINFNFIKVDRIQRDKSGKLRYFIPLNNEVA